MKKYNPDRLKTLLEKRNLPLKELTSKLRRETGGLFSLSTARHWTEDTPPRTGTLALIADILGVSIDEFFSDDDNMLE